MLGYLIGIPTGRADWKICGGCWTLEQAFVCPYDVHFESSSTAATATQCIKITKKYLIWILRKYFVFAEYFGNCFSWNTFEYFCLNWPNFDFKKHCVFFCNFVFWTPRQICIFHLFSSWNTRFCKMSTHSIHQVFVS